uniref:response regulator n=1 Tax=Accumulibacter sp. TaxID=2053492 RepID=UPI0035ADED1A
REAERLAAEEAARREAERLVAEEAARREAERLAAEEAARLEADRLAVEEALRLEEEERLAVEAAIEREAARQAVEEARRRELAAVPPPAPAPRTAEQTVVMVADDSKVVRIKTGRLLAAHRFQVVLAEDGEDAARQIKTALPDVLVTDVDMPGMTGLQLARQVRGDPRTAALPIIIVTSDSDQLQDEAAAAGVNVVLGKPYPEALLIEHVQQLARVKAGV